MARRRRDLSRSSRYFRSLLLFSFLLFSFFSLNLPKNPKFSSSSYGVFFSDRQLCNGVREQCFIISLYQTSPTNLSWNRATEVLHQSNDISGQTSNESRSGPTMDVVTLPLPPPSTLTPAPPFPARRSMPSHGAHVFFAVILEPSDESSIKMVAPLGDSPPIIIRNLQNGGVDNSNIFSSNNDNTRVWLDGPHLFWWPNTPTRPMIQNCKEVQLIHIQALCMLTDSSPSLSKPRYTPFNILSRSLLKIWCSIKNGRRRHSILVSTSSAETYIHQCQNLVNRVDGLSPNATLSVASSMEQIIKSSYASFARAIYDHKLIRNFKFEFLKVSKDSPTFANSLKKCILDYSLSLYLFLSCFSLLSACMNFPPLRI